MSAKSEQKPRYWNYPSPREAPAVLYQNEASPNPILRGYALAVAVWILSASSFVSGILWKKANFDKLKDLKELSGYEPRYDPTVIPIEDYPPPLPRASETASTKALPAPRPRANAGQHYTSADYVSLYNSGRLTPSDVVEAIIPLIGKDAAAGRHSIAFLESNADLIREAARASTKRYRGNRSLGPLDGVLVAVKDEVDLKGYKRTLGSRLDFTNPGNRTAWCVERWEEAGAIVLGKTNMHEIGLDTTNNNPITGTPLNPHDPSHYCGGSSGGSAYAIASGLVPIAHGADGGGSIRIPSAMCGLYGLKPTHGRVSARPTVGMAYSVGVDGPMAASIDDLRLAYRVMAKPDPGCPSSGMFPEPARASIKLPSKPFTTQDAGAKKQKFLGICTPLITRACPRTRSLFDRAIAHYTKSCDYATVEITLPFLPEAQKAHALTILSEVGLSFTSASENQAWQYKISKLSRPSQLLLLSATRHTTAADFLAAQRMRNLVMQHLAYLWQEYPGMIIVTPTLPDQGMPIKNPKDVTSSPGTSESWGMWDGDASLRSMEFAFLANFTGCPSLSRPLAYITTNGEATDGKAVERAPVKQAKLPLGIQGMAEWGREEELMDWAEDGVIFVQEEDDNHNTEEVEAKLKSKALADHVEEATPEHGMRTVDDVAAGGCRHPPPVSLGFAAGRGDAGTEGIGSAGWVDVLGLLYGPDRVGSSS